MDLNHSYKQNIGSLVGRTAKLMARAILENFRLEGYEFGMDHWLVLVHLWREDGINQQTLGRFAGHNKTTVTRAINWLEENDLVVRITDQSDRRIKRIFLTRKGKNLRTELEPIMDEVLEEATKGIDQESIETCKKVLSTMFTNLKQYI